MQKKLVQSSLAMTAAAALGLGGAFVAGPAMADEPEALEIQSESDLQNAVAEHLTEDSGEIPEEIGRFGFSGGHLKLGVTEKTAEVQELEKKYDNVDVKVGSQYASFEAQAAKDLVGGAGYLMESPEAGKVGICSTGFAGWDSKGNQVVLTAGHCAEHTDGAGNPAGTNPILDMELPSAAKAAGGEQTAPAEVGSPGEWDFYQYGLPGVEAPANEDEEKLAIDFASFKVSGDFTNHAEVTDWTTADEDDLSLSTTPVKSIGDPTVGATVSKSGRTTGKTSGTVATGVDDDMPYAAVSDRVVHGFQVDANDGVFSQQGDSGGAVYQGETAVGVISGGNPDGSMGWVADLKNSLEKSGVDFQLTKPDDGGDDAENDADADAAANDAEADSGADGEDADSSSAADGDEANADADAKGSDADADADGKDSDGADDADGKDADASSGADGKDDKADSDADGNEKPEAPKVGDQTVVEGGQITGQAVPNAEVKLTWKPAGANAGSSQASAQAAPAQGSTTVKTDANGKFTAEAPAEAGDYNYTAVVHANGQDSAATEFVVTVEAEEAPAERKLSIEPKEVAASDFVQQDKGVQITAEGFDEGEEVTLEVVAGPENVEGITLDEVANEDGVVGFSIYGTNASDPSAYLGKYDLQVTGANDAEDEDALTGSFEVVADEDGNGGGTGGDDDGNNDDGNGDGGSDLPRTGAELTGLAAGAGLLVVGGAAVVLTMRRKKNN
ncbi:LPXTG cell wall anchor domain-containing protein [Brevibacterium renqingii]|uniref:LPXTG cell wall anchor domain-containing protein n=1 Tax=Brevibacterium renqingii TaxID=2776916 RepID=UPI001ADF8DE7|nr:LPXTG cell wall anchor domain-containing protein [Brevibacterium renqingii]